MRSYRQTLFLVLALALLPGNKAWENGPYGNCRGWDALVPQEIPFASLKPPYFTPELGEPIYPYGLDLSVPPNAKIFKLGKGEFGAVYRIEESNGQSFVVKVYEDYEAKEMDLARFSYLAKVLNKSPRLPRVRFHLAQATELPGNQTRLNFVPGRTLASLLDSRDTPTSLHLELIRRFDLLLQNLRADLATQGAVFSSFGSPIMVKDRRGKFTIDFLLHHGNILVDPNTLEMTIIDPY